jgi:hypothetical protein
MRLGEVQAILLGKGLEKMLLKFFAHADPVIADLVNDLDSLGGEDLATDRIGDAPTFRGILHRIGKEVEDDLVAAEFIR